jgi:glycosyltransferase 2 family protein
VRALPAGGSGLALGSAYHVGVAWRDLLRRGAEAGLELANARRVRIAAQLLLVAGLVFVGLRLRSFWHDSHIQLAHVGWGWLAGALVLAIASVVASSFIWLEILKLLGIATRPSWTAAYLQGQLAKYVPGSVWQYASRGVLATGRGVPLRVAMRSVPIELSATAYVAAACSMLLVGWWGALGVMAALAGATVATASRKHPVRTAGRVAPLYAGAWALTGASFWMIARSFVPISAGEFPVYAGAFAAAWLVGLVAIYAPGGIGVREALLVAILGPRIGTADAVLVAAASRVVFTLGDLAAAGLSLLTRRRAHRPAAKPASG